MLPDDVSAGAPHFIETHFYGEWHGSVSYACPGDFEYIRIWKDANNAIRYNMKKIEECCEADGNASHEICYHEGNPTDGCVRCGDGMLQRGDNTSAVRPVTFTFTRDPVSLARPVTFTFTLDVYFYS